MNKTFHPLSKYLGKVAGSVFEFQNGCKEEFVRLERSRFGSRTLKAVRKDGTEATFDSKVLVHLLA